ncbi:MAG: N-acetyltransferase [Bacteroidetes bacterium]|nr:MAG: N-acetyltransferase [Bacteroidota bacterium]
MNDHLNISISQTKERKHIEICARMMAGTDPWIRYGMDYDLCLKAFEGAFREIYILQIDEVIAGFAILQVTGTFKGYIQSLCISEERRGHGLGNKLLQFCEERILQISPNIFICVSEFNVGALKLYKEFGFKLIGELHDFLQPGLTELLMRKTHGPILKWDSREGLTPRRQGQ